ncbi:hypothetical protein C8N43_2953 [Litoreibacter ponti]|uniref:Uncharacterized protein n=1 Tax=Litoreibacter ponti TaxID=1510457 RepID=A0A2T6BDL7_9RHOB|nr:hypothetical protein C8N43_2953 [Litoreibacter ponti]
MFPLNTLAGGPMSAGALQKIAYVLLLGLVALASSGVL